MFYYTLKNLNGRQITLYTTNKVHQDTFKMMYDNAKKYIVKSLKNPTVNDIATCLCDKYDFKVIVPVSEITYIPDNLKCNESEEINEGNKASAEEFFRNY